MTTRANTKYDGIPADFPPFEGYGPETQLPHIHELSLDGLWQLRETFSEELAFLEEHNAGRVRAVYLQQAVSEIDAELQRRGEAVSE